MYSMSAWLYRCHKAFLVPLVAEEKSLLKRLLAICKEEKIDIILPGVDAELLFLSKNKDVFKKETNTEVFIPEYMATRRFCDKYATYKFFKKKHIPFPETILLTSTEKIKAFIEKTKFPVFLKSRFGQGNKNTKIINSFLDLEPAIGNALYILQEYLPNNEEEYTSGVYVGKDEKIKGLCTFKRELRGGTTYRAEVVDDQKIKQTLCDIVAGMEMKGFFNIQSRNTENGLVPFEINPRFSGTTAMVNEFAFNGPEMAIDETLNKKKLKIITDIKLGFAMRYWNEIYVSPDKIKDMELNHSVINKNR